ncbi:LOW QUALITY PROTEIN: uncharacterized protein [Excalfactoria chinensis]|uniref:LOW QUALITY PROTEIN: uncharacterized protein n=1 Tax=Excalfactoria chinensis TaxID=46218 RepID=UPI003B3A36DD
MGQKLCKWLRSTRTACAETQEDVGSEEPACVLCGRVDEDSGILGCKVEIDGLYIHEFCVIFASGLCQYMEGSEARFCAEDITRTVREAEQTLCFVCGSSGATVICAEPGCEQSFHLPCAYEGQCVTQFFGALRAFCREHSPQQAVQAEPAPDTTCLICMEPVGDSRSYGTMVCPACQHAWFHRACVQVGALPLSCSTAGAQQHQAALSSPTLLVFLLQEQALSAGIYCFRCPHCRDKESFLREMLNVGIRIPFRKPTWDDNYTYSSLGVRYERCVAINCLYPLGRGHSGEGPWEMLLCSSCAARATHRRCSQLSNSTTSWECNSCAAGEGTASSTRSRLAGLGTTSQQGLRPSRGSSTESSSSGTSIQAPPGPAHRSGVPESSGLSIQRRTDRRGITPRARQDANSLNESRGRRGRTRSAAPIAGSSSTDSASQGTSRSSRRCPALRYNRRFARRGRGPSAMGQTLCSWFRSIQEDVGSEEPACVLCGLEDEDSGILGYNQSFRRLSYHEFCARFASGLCENVQDNNEAPFHFEDLTRTVREAEQKLCFVCGSSGATITCADPDCERTFHLPCAYEGQCVTQYFGEFR